MRLSEVISKRYEVEGKAQPTGYSPALWSDVAEALKAGVPKMSVADLKVLLAGAAKSAKKSMAKSGTSFLISFLSDLSAGLRGEPGEEGAEE